jgi:hypothetical protein
VPVVAELGCARQAIPEVTGVPPLYMRGGDIDNRVHAISLTMGMHPIIWTRNLTKAEQFDINDWRGPSALVVKSPIPSPSNYSRTSSCDATERWLHLLRLSTIGELSVPSPLSPASDLPSVASEQSQVITYHSFNHHRTIMCFVTLLPPLYSTVYSAYMPGSICFLIVCPYPTLIKALQVKPRRSLPDLALFHVPHPLSGRSACIPVILIPPVPPHKRDERASQHQENEG